ncbi:MAG: hypothetical protein PHQ34_05665 [Methanothrix sp.]|nr:hypothetical protein [Methanothrix sp.]
MTKTVCPSLSAELRPLPRVVEADGLLAGGRGIDGIERQGDLDLASFCVA